MFVSRPTTDPITPNYIIPLAKLEGSTTFHVPGFGWVPTEARNQARAVRRSTRGWNVASAPRAGRTGTMTYRAGGTYGGTVTVSTMTKAERARMRRNARLILAGNMLRGRYAR